MTTLEQIKEQLIAMVKLQIFNNTYSQLIQDRDNSNIILAPKFLFHNARASHIDIQNTILGYTDKIEYFVPDEMLQEFVKYMTVRYHKEVLPKLKEELIRLESAIDSNVNMDLFKDIPVNIPNRYRYVFDSIKSEKRTGFTEFELEDISDKDVEIYIREVMTKKMESHMNFKPISFDDVCINYIVFNILYNNGAGIYKAPDGCKKLMREAVQNKDWVLSHLDRYLGMNSSLDNAMRDFRQKRRWGERKTLPIQVCREILFTDTPVEFLIEAYIKKEN